MVTIYFFDLIAFDNIFLITFDVFSFITFDDQVTIIPYPLTAIILDSYILIFFTMNEDLLLSFLIFEMNLVKPIASF